MLFLNEYELGKFVILLRLVFKFNLQLSDFIVL